ncbi:MAG: HIT family protein [Anaerolineales bacterium]|nr:HIT family protein [Anaerolineales bacterium]
MICRKQHGDFSPRGGPVYEDDLVYACHAHISDDQTDQYLGWLVLETRRHVPDLASLTEAEAQRVGMLAGRLARVLKAELNAMKVYAFVVGEGMAHFHMHLIPRYPGTPHEFWGGHIDEWPGAPRGSKLDIEELCRKLCAQMNIDKN